MTGRSAWLLCSGVLLWCVSQCWERSLGLDDPRVTSALQFLRTLPDFYIAHCGWSIHVSSVLCISVFTLFTVTGSSTFHLCSTGISGRKRATVACYTPLRLFRGLCSLLLDCGKCENWWCGPKRLIGPRRVKSWKRDFTRLRLRCRSHV